MDGDAGGLAAGVRVHSQYIGQKPRRVRFSPSTAQPGARFFAVGGWDSPNCEVALYNALAPASASYDSAQPAVARHLSSLPLDGADTAGLAFLSEEILLAALGDGSVIMIHVDPQIGALKPRARREKLHYLPCNVNAAAADLAAAESRDCFATVGEDGRLNFIDAGRSDLPVVWSYGNDGLGQALCAVTFTSLHGNYHLAATTATGQLLLFDMRASGENPVAAPQESISEDGELHAALSVAAHPAQPETLVVGGSDGVVAVWDITKPKYPVSLTQAHSAEVWDVKFHPLFGSQLFTAGQDGLLLHWDTNPMRSQLQPAFSMGTDKSDIRITNLMSGASSLAVNSLDVADDMVVAGTDNEALLLFNHLPLHADS